ADAILLVVRCVGDRLSELHAMASTLGMDVLVEVFDEAEAQAALDIGADLVGINHRDLETFEVDNRRTASLAPMLSGRATVVSLSGVSSREEVVELARHGVEAVLVGESLVTAADPAEKVKELLG
ncbi:MAG: indole-3-glycerol phosphate synthase TrpC, partial [Actinomycetota bacterium]